MNSKSRSKEDKEREKEREWEGVGGGRKKSIVRLERVRMDHRLVIYVKGEPRADEKRGYAVLLYPESTATLNRNQSATDFYRDLPP